MKNNRIKKNLFYHIEANIIKLMGNIMLCIINKIIVPKITLKIKILLKVA
jgi:hypothetical protein